MSLKIYICIIISTTIYIVLNWGGAIFFLQVKYWSLKRPFVVFRLSKNSLSTFSSDTPGQLDILGHDGNSLGVDGAQVGVLKQTNQVSLTGFLQGHNSRALEAEVSLEILGDFSDQPLEGQLPDEQLSALLVTSDFSQSYGSRPVPVWLLHTTGCWCTFPCSLGGQLLAGGLASSGFPCCLLCTCHYFVIMMPDFACASMYISVL